MHAAGAEHAPGRPGGCVRLATHAPAELDETAVGLGVVAAPAAGHDVVPDMLAAATARDDVVETRCRRGAIDTTSTVARENGAAGERDVGAVGNLHKTGEAYDD